MKKNVMLVSLGGVVIAASAAFLFADVVARGGAIAPYEALPAPQGWPAAAGRAIAGEITPIFWAAWLVVLCGALNLVAGRRAGAAADPATRRPIRLLTCFFGSIAIWAVFDWYNFEFMHAWDYHGLASDPVRRYASFFVAFGAICPAMFLTADILLAAGLSSVAGPKVHLTRLGRAILVAIGIACAVFPLLVATPIGSITLWLAFLLILDPINHRLRAPSVIGDIQSGLWGRPLALMAAGPICGLLWEFWNYWATAKWTYDLPFLGPLEQVRYFEMPLVGMLGYLPFALECWAMFNMLAFLLRRTGLVRVEPLPNDSAL